MSHIFALVGFMGCGKSTLGQQAAERLGLPFRDLDRMVEDAAGATVAEVFSRQGEASFRALEAEALGRALDELAGGGILATGGGAFVDPASRRLLARPGVVTVWIDVPLAAIVQRVPRDGSRPLLGDPEALDRLFAARRELYRAADLRVDAGSASLEETAERLIRVLRAGPARQAS